MVVTRTKLIGVITAIGVIVGGFLVLTVTANDAATERTHDARHEAIDYSRASAQRDLIAEKTGATAQDLPSRAGTSSRVKARISWYEEFRESKDYLDFVRRAGPAAEQGDHRAAWELAQLMSKCALPIRSVRAGESRDVYMAAAHALLAASDPQYVMRRTETYGLCAPLASDPSLSEWTQDFGKLGLQHWREMALALGNPTAQTENLIEKASRLSGITAGDLRKQTVQEIRIQVGDVIRSQDGEAWYQLGMRFGNSDVAKDVTLGYALAMASCDLGYDCTGGNERNRWCTEGPCSTPTDLNQKLRAMMKPAMYARVYANYQQLVQLIERGEWEEVAKKYVPLDGMVFREAG